MTWVRTVPPVDEIDREGERVVLVPGRAVHVLGIAPVVLDLARGWVELPDLVDALEAELGPDPGGQGAILVEAAVRQLAAEGLVEVAEQ